MDGRRSALSASLNTERAAAVVHLQLTKHKEMHWQYIVPYFLAEGNKALCKAGSWASAGWH